MTQSVPSAPALGQDPQPTGLNVRRLIWIRMIAVPGSALCLLFARQIYALPIPAGMLPGEVTFQAASFVPAGGAFLSDFNLSNGLTVRAGLTGCQ